MTTIATALTHAQQQLLRADTDSARLDAEILLSTVLDCDRSYLYTWPQKELTSTQDDLFSTKLQRRISGEPVAYITGKKEFWSLMLEVNASTLIPRPETELLIAVALRKFSDKETTNNFIEVLDLGTGTGAIALALAKEMPAWQILACDVKPEVVHLAQHNVRALGIHNVTCVASDWFSHINNKTFDLIVSNPPYIDALDEHLLQGDVRFEPRTALVADKNGLADLERIIEQSIVYLKSAGWLMVEHGFTQGAAVRALFDRFAYSAIETFTDLAGKDRVTIGKKSFGEQTHG